MAFILTRINVGDHERWKSMFDQDAPGALSEAKGQLLAGLMSAPAVHCD